VARRRSAAPQPRARRGGTAIEPPPRPPAWPGEFGLLLLEYTGQAPSVRWWPGLTTGARYPFGGERRLGYVDLRDAAAWLNQRGECCFRTGREDAGSDRRQTDQAGAAE
jgi:hypothetical protein